MTMQSPSYAQTTDEVLAAHETTASGLTDHEAERRLRRFGPNALPQARVDSLLTIFCRQFQSPLIYVLLGASLTVFLLGETTDALIIVFVLMFNASIGTIQEGRAQNTLKALKQLAATATTALRSGEQKLLPDQALVPGDVVLLQEGQRIPADVRILEAYSLSVNESALTGESVPVFKNAERLGSSASSIGVADQRNMAFRGTFVATGRAKAVVVATGLQTEIGKIARSVETISTDIPLKRSVQRLTHQIITVIGSVSVGLFVLGLVRGYSIREMFATTVSLAVSAIPEGLPIVLTLVLATGVWRMSKRHALVKKLNAVEALGQATVIAVDKTGTITQNKLSVTSLYVGGQTYVVSGNGYDPHGEVLHGATPVNPQRLSSQLRMALQIAVAGDSARVFWDPPSEEWQISGDPTEAALLVFGMKLGFDHARLSQRGRRLAEYPFEYERKYRASVYAAGAQSLILVSGAPEQVMALCHWSEKERTAAEHTLSEFAQQGQRVVALAYKEHAAQVDIHKLPKLTFGGLVGMKDALHPEVKSTVQRVLAAGIRVIMLTGDHRETAKAIATEAGIFRVGDRVMTGAQLEKLSVEALAAQLPSITVFARVTPTHKLTIVQAYRQRGEVIAMTGDGVNDAPSLVAADLGMAMGKSGTEVAKEAADIVLLDDNFTSIVAAIEEGRSIYTTIKKVITYLFATSAGEILVIGSSLLLNIPLPVTAAQIIWLNLVTDGFLDVALAMEPKDKRLLGQPWMGNSSSLVDGLMLKRIALFAIVMTVGTLLIVQYFESADRVRLSSLALTVMAMYQWFNAWNSRSAVQSVFQRDGAANRYLLAATGLVVLLQLAALNTPFLQAILHTEPLSLSDWLMGLAVASSALWAEELRKMLHTSSSPLRSKRQRSK